VTNDLPSLLTARRELVTARHLSFYKMIEEERSLEEGLVHPVTNSEESFAHRRRLLAELYERLFTENGLLRLYRRGRRPVYSSPRRSGYTTTVHATAQNRQEPRFAPCLDHRHVASGDNAFSYRGRSGNSLSAISNSCDRVYITVILGV
jgi:hypothetical protein